MRKILKTPLTDLDLSVRALESLEKNKITSLEELVAIGVDKDLDDDTAAELEAIIAKERLRIVPHTETIVADNLKQKRKLK